MKLEYDIPYGAEKWVPLNFYGEILSRYSVSDYGRVYDHDRSAILPVENTYNGYQRVRIHLGYRNGKNYSLHRAVILSFNPIPNFKEMQVNHIDGNKHNNKLSNLEWVFPRDNIRHSINTGLRDNTGINSPVNVYSEETIHEACRLIDLGMSNSEIADKMGYTDISKERFMATVNQVRKGNGWKHISCQYNFMSDNTFPVYDDFFINLLCCFLSDQNKNYTYKEIMDLLQIPENERTNLYYFINRLVAGNTASHITKDYPNLKKPLTEPKPLFYH